MTRIDVRGLAGAPLGEALEPVARHLDGGGLIGYPTSTVYGFGSAVTPEGTRRLARLKGRDPDRPFLLLVPEADPLDDFHWTGAARTMAEAFWPGPLTLVLRAAAHGLSDTVRNRQGGVALRRSDHPVVRALLDRFGRPITSTSANPPGAPPATDGQACEAAWHSLGGASGGGLILDAGPLPPSASSTIVDCLGPTPIIRREGAVSEAQLRRLVPELLAAPARP